MTLIEGELKIVKIKELLEQKLTIPEYQRPYRWSEKSTNTLFTDTYNAFKSGINEYRLGSVILHKNFPNEDYRIVDGQQRTTTLSMLLYALGDDIQTLLKQEYQPSSYEAINKNFVLLKKRCLELSDGERKKYKEYVQEKCTLVQIVTDSEQEAFQFFDSQNSRGKALKPHDLLKSYHLREMNHDLEQLKRQLISSWEETDQTALEDLFRNYLYPVIRWFKHKDGLNYSSDKIHDFKGIKQSNTYNYATYHKASNIFIEQINASGSRELLSSEELNQFQLTQPIMAGKRFFAWTLHYANLLDKVKHKIEDYHQPEQIPSQRTGDIYIKQLYEASLLFFADRFSFEAIDDSVMHQLYTWCYSLRLKMKAVYPQTINKYACGRHERINENKDLFTQMSEMIDAQDLKILLMDKIEDPNDNYKAVYDVLKEWNGW
ncbi:DUF262 domain-containing protein [Streptococcus sp. CSL10205-OR2]|uniref:DUF262 domain-containing protein n=1 Tax=Streptococcus sp. CSL10205-OR2 TaxID=2980558 RepID=UPI0021DAC4C9|nr:DUF262 domain-containing protein [Streptococcus sp. CSL10205-OR2]MCU9533702.1 DUF262 domain-containing protein [Streptococcus sp. CSL10205-OR2]